MRSRFRLLEPAVDDRRRPDPAPAAHRLQPVAEVAPLELVQEMAHEARPRRAERAPDGDRAAVDIGFGEVGAGLLLPGQHNRGKGLIDLEEVDIAELEAG